MGLYDKNLDYGPWMRVLFKDGSCEFVQQKRCWEYESDHDWLETRPTTDEEIGAILNMGMHPENGVMM